MSAHKTPIGRDVILLAGLWLPGSVWDEVATELIRAGHRPLIPRLPGVEGGAPNATLDDQLSAVLADVDLADRPVVVGHSAAATLAWLVADRRPSAVDRVVLIGGFPTTGGQLYADFFPIADGAMPFPGWEPFEGPDAADLDQTARQHLEALAVPVPEGVARACVGYTDEARFEVPVTLLCPEFSPDDARGWIDGGDVPELARVSSLSYVDLDSGHWPMTSRATELARVLGAAAQQ